MRIPLNFLIASGTTNLYPLPIDETLVRLPAQYGLNSQYAVFDSQNCVRAIHIQFGGLCFARTRVRMADSSGFMVVQPPYCAGRLVFWHTNRWDYKKWYQADFQLPGSISQFGIDPGDAGNRWGINFSGSNTHAWYVNLLHNVILDWPQKSVHKLHLWQKMSHACLNTHLAFYYLNVITKCMRNPVHNVIHPSNQSNHFCSQIHLSNNDITCKSLDRFTFMIWHALAHPVE